MSAVTSTQQDAKPRMLTLRGGGWVLLLAAVLCLFIVIKHGFMIVQSLRLRDGRVPVLSASNGFDLQSAIVEIPTIKQTFNRDGLRALGGFDADGKFHQPKHLLDMKTLKKKWGKKYLVPGDLIIGVNIGGEARVYPVRVMDWHEVANDILGGQAIAVTYNGISGTAAVYSRQFEDGETSFAHSGLLLDSNLLFYDKRDNLSDSSLFSQAMGKAIQGPRAGNSLTMLPCELVTLSDWMQRYPNSSIVPGQAALFKKCYKKMTYQTYLKKQQIKFPLSDMPLTPNEAFEPMLVLYSGTTKQAFSYPEVAKQVDEYGRWPTDFAGHPLTFIYQAENNIRPATLRFESTAAEPPTSRYMLRFAWYTSENIAARTPTEAK